MRRILILSLVFLSLHALSAVAQKIDPEQYIYPLVGVDGSCTANFGEMRPGHFHAGVDIRTEGVEGKKLVAVADGYISRVYLAAGGYGRAIYITHNNGTMSVYGHLQRFRNDIEKHVIAERYARKSNYLDLYFTPDRWPVKQGDFIGYSGNSGGSMGPHLHFEIRNASTQQLYNPVKTGIITPADTLAPRILKLHYMEVDSVESAGVCMQSPMRSYSAVRERGGKYRLTRETPIEVGRKGYFVCEVTDRRNGTHNRFGVWRVTAYIDGKAYFEYQMNGFTFNHSRYCDAVSYYPLQLKVRTEAIRLARLNNTPNYFYPTLIERGLVRTAPGEKRHIRIEAEDDSGNISELEFDIVGSEESFKAEVDPGARLLYAYNNNNLGIGTAAHAMIPSGALHENIYTRVSQRPYSDPKSKLTILSDLYRILPPYTPLKHPMTVAIKADIPESLRQHAVMAIKTPRGLSYAGGKYYKGEVIVKSSSWGEYIVVADTEAPTVKANFKPGENLRNRSSVTFHIRDNFSGSSNYQVSVDGKWVPADRFPMKGTVVYKFDKPADRRTHTITVKVTDGAGNTRTFSSKYVR